MQKFCLVWILTFTNSILHAQDIQPTLSLEWVIQAQQEIDELKNEIKRNIRIPTGTIVAYYGNNIPAGWMLCDGSTIPSDFSDLKALIGEKVPDLRGMFLRGKSGNRQIGDVQQDSLADHTHNHYAAAIYQPIGPTFSKALIDHNIGQGQASSMGVNNSKGSSETRPVNVAINYIIKI